MRVIGRLLYSRLGVRI